MNIKYSIVVVGAGGTGGYFLKEFSRFLKGAEKMVDLNNLYIVDGDTIEMKNTSRQSFFEEDIGLNKAAVMAEQLFANFGIPWKAVGKYLLEDKDLLELIPKNKGVVPVIIGGVDNHGCRILMEKVFHSLDRCVYLDSANEFENGEVVFSLRNDGKTLAPCRSYYFPEVLKGDTRNRDEISCTELNQVAPQHIVTNMLAGNILLSGICKIFQGGFEPGVVLFNSFNNTTQFVKFQGERVNVSL